MDWPLKVTIIFGVISFFSAIIAALIGLSLKRHLDGYDKTKEMLFSQIHNIENEINDLEKTMLDKYVKKDDIEKQFDRLFDELEKIKDKLENHAKQEQQTN